MRGAPIWLTWEDHRRSRELAAALNATYIPLLVDLPRALRYIILAPKTLAAIARYRPRLIYCQNPSIVLTALLAITRRFHGAPLVVDRHTNFRFDTLRSRSPIWRLYHVLSRLTDRLADLTIVTNEFLADWVKADGGRAVVLTDPLPNIAPSNRIYSGGEPAHIVVVGSGARDEPLPEILDAASSLGSRIHVAITSGGAKKAATRYLVPANVNFPGFLPYEDYLDLLRSADLVVVLTKQAHTLCCGAYEAVSLHRPMVLSNFDTITNHFSRGAVYASPTAASIAKEIAAALENWPTLYEQVVAAERVMRPTWNSAFQRVLAEISRLTASTAAR